MIGSGADLLEDVGVARELIRTEENAGKAVDVSGPPNVLSSMRSHLKLAAPLIALSSIVIVLAGCTSSTTSTPTQSSIASITPQRGSEQSAASLGAALTISGFAFSPLTVKVGETVTVTNTDNAEHTVTAKDAEIDVKVPPGGSVTFVAPQVAGTYGLTCDFHPDMTGTMTVVE